MRPESVESGSPGGSRPGLSSPSVPRTYPHLHIPAQSHLTRPGYRIAIVLAFTVPRVPSFSTNQLEPLSPATAPFNESIPIEFSRSPTNFSFPGMMKLQADTGGNYLPLTFNNIHGSVFDLTTGRQVASGDTGKVTVPAKAFPVIQLNLNFTYSAVNTSDITCA